MACAKVPSVGNRPLRAVLCYD